MTVCDHVSGGGPVRAAAPYIQLAETVPEPVPETVSECTPESVPEIVPECAPESVPKSAPESVPEMRTRDGEARIAALRRCRRCFLYEMDGQETYYQSIVRLRQAMPASEKADDAEYARRLSVCRECPYLDNATCMQCGCYAEVRALKRAARCPAKRW